MDRDINTLWALIAGSLLLVMAVGVVAVVEGLTRRRSVATGATRYLGGFIGAVLSAVGCGHALGQGAGNAWVGTQGFFLSDIDLGARASLDSATAGAELFAMIGVSVLFVSIVMSALAERATFLAHVVVGVTAGGVLVPLARRALTPEGLLGSIRIGDSGFVDSSAASVFSLAAWCALVGAMVIGPRLGLIGSTGNVRVIPGRSPWTAAAGAMLVVAGSVGLAAHPEPLWGDEVVVAALALVVGAAAGASAGSALSLRRFGIVSIPAATRGVLAGIAATSGALLDVSPMAAVALGAAGGAAAEVLATALDRWRVDDPAGLVAGVGAGGMVGTLGASAFDVDQFLAQVIGQLIVAAWSIVVAGLVFGVLRVTRSLRISADLEMVGLER